MGEVPAELAFPRAPSISDPEGFSSYLRQYDVFIETTTQMLATPKLHERLLLALEAIANVFGHRQGAIATINTAASSVVPKRRNMIRLSGVQILVSSNKEQSYERRKAWPISAGQGSKASATCQ